MANNKLINQYVVYILECVNGCYYIGYTTDMKRRYQEHVDGSDKCKYTRSFPPIKIAAYWTIHSSNASLALKVESQLKRLSKRAKTALIAKPSSLIDTVICERHDKIIPAKICHPSLRSAK